MNNNPVQELINALRQSNNYQLANEIQRNPNSLELIYRQECQRRGINPDEYKEHFLKNYPR